MIWLWTRRAANIAGVVLCIFMLIYFTHTRLWSSNGLNNTRPISDSSIFFDSGKALYSGRSPYYIYTEALESDAVFPGSLYCYLPTLATLLAPLTPLSIAAKNLVWYTVITLSLIISVYLLYRIALLAGLAPPQGWRFPVTVGITALLFEPIQNNYVHGQSNTLLLLSIVGFMYCFLQKRPYLAGILLGFGITLKFFPLIFIPFLFFRREWKIIGSSILATLFFLALPLLYCNGITIYSDFFTVFTARSSSNYQFLEFFTTLYRTCIWFIPTLESRIVKASCILLTLLLLCGIDFFLRRKSWKTPQQKVSADALMLSVFTTSILLIHPHSEVHIMLFALPGFMLSGMYALKRASILSILAWAIVYGLFVPMLWVESTPVTFFSLIALNIYCIYAANTGYTTTTQESR